jgi:alkylation response protein AidB-like acyl-CoA dehydrogenase
MDFTLNEERQMVQQLVRDFAEKEIKPNADEWNKAKRVPVEIFEKLAEMGLMGPLISEKYGGADLGTMGFSLILTELSRGDASVGALWGGHVTLGSLPFLTHGTEEQKERWLKPLAQGKHLGAFALSEPDAGSDAQGVKTTAQKDGDEWVINGRKTMITNAGTPISYGSIILALTGEEDGKKQFTAFVVPNGTPGYQLGQEFEKMGWHGTDTFELIFEDCRVPDDHRLGEVGGGLGQFLSTLEVARISLASQSVGLAQACYEASLKYAQERVQFGRPISKFQAIRFKLASMATEIEVARLGVLKAAWLRDQGQPITLAASMAKLYASEMVNRVADHAVQIHGGYGFMEEYPVSRYYRDARIFTLGGGTSEIQHLIISKQLLGG